MNRIQVVREPFRPFSLDIVQGCQCFVECGTGCVGFLRIVRPFFDQPMKFQESFATAKSVDCRMRDLLPFVPECVRSFQVFPLPPRAHSIVFGCLLRRQITPAADSLHSSTSYAVTG